MIHTIRTVAVGDQESKIDSPIILYRGDREVEVEFTINGSKFTFTNGGNVIKSTNAKHGQLVINTPTGENMFSEVTECHDGKVVFVITKEMIDELIEVGFYSFQIRLFDESQVSRVTIPPVLKGIDIRNPIAAEDETNVVDIGLVDYAVVVKDEFEDLSTFLPDGNYNKTEWESKDVISAAKLNKIEDALYNINGNMESSDLALLNRIENIKQSVNRDFKELSDEIESEVEEFEREINNNVDKFKIDVDNTIKNECDLIDTKITHISQQNVIDYKDLVIDGDWSYAIQEAINNITDKGVVYLPQVCTIKRTVKVNKCVSFTGNGHSKIICDYSNWGGHEFGASVPQKTALFIEAREPIYLTHLDDMNLNIGGFYLYATGNTKDTRGIYLGYKDISLMTQSSSVNYSVMGKRFSNIALYGFSIGIEVSEVWDCTFEDIIVRMNPDSTTGILIEGQSVNNFFKNCRVYGNNGTGTALKVLGKTYPSKYSRPEGIIFDGGFYGECDTGIYHKDGLFCNYTNLVVDLNNIYAMRIGNGDCSCIANCYLYSNGEYTMLLDGIHTLENNLSISISDNHFVGTPNNKYAIGNADNWSGLIIKGNSFTCYQRDACIFLGYNTQCIISNNIFKNNKLTHLIIHTNSTELSEFNNITKERINMIASIDGSIPSTKVNSDIYLNNHSIINGSTAIGMRNNEINLTLPGIENLRINNKHFMACVNLSDCNNIPSINCFIVVLAGALNAPGGGNWAGHQIIYDDNFVYQELRTTDGTLALRFRLNGEWQTWRFQVLS